ncbi:hypothetical protein NUW58_g1093 [Xylaria curta]|uniref:Uncharacterized protein n=2 Tax=Xylaria curta TaxID=42375 RepID=A0ACC1PLH1_9PEZI|nr:hypothetical protein NUW58_g1766 [Xylaria curta]KAJ2996077.1 hypothetical protein NUW58_g1093 [Xylaria curta]
MHEHGHFPAEHAGSGGPKNVDDTSKRSDWVTSYDPKANSKNVDDTSKRSDWVTSYESMAAIPKNGYWVPSGPSYLELDFSPIHHDNLVTLATAQRLHTENLSGFKKTVARFFNM